MIEFKDVSKVYDNNVKALSNVNIKINSGDFVFLVGPSGAGKSTFIKMLLKETGKIRLIKKAKKAIKIGFIQQLKMQIKNYLK